MNARRVAGAVKWFDIEKGFGFILCEELDADVLLHANVLRSFGQSSVADGSAILMMVHQSARGWQATEVLAISPPDPLAPVLVAPGLPRPAPAPEGGLPELDALRPARIKWFDKVRGFGFANVFGREEEVFVHANILRAAGLSDLAPGEAVALRVVKGARGASADLLMPWDMAARLSGSARGDAPSGEAAGEASGEAPAPGEPEGEA